MFTQPCKRDDCSSVYTGFVEGLTILRSRTNCQYGCLVQASFLRGRRLAMSCSEPGHRALAAILPPSGPVC
jgi:hypothetical protein